MRLFGAIFVVLGSIGLALCYSNGRRKEILTLEELRDILEWIEGEIRYGRTSLPECFLQVGAQRPTALGKAFQEAGWRQLQTPRENMRDLMEDGLKQELSQVLTTVEYQRLFEFISPDGYRDEGMQRRALERSRNGMEELLKLRKEEYRGKCRVAWSLGAMGGLFIILLLW